MKINYPLACESWDNAELEAMQEVIKSGRFTMGARVSEFEARAAQWFGSKYAVMVNSGSSANLLAVAALFFVKENKLKRGDEVIVPAVSWSTTYAPLQQYGLKLKFVDINPETLNFDLNEVASAITDKTRLIFAVNLLGNPNDFNALNKIIEGKNIYLLEDNCESMGATFDNKMAGTFGIMGTFSTFFSHHISTMEGGFVLTENEELYHILLSIRAHGWTRNLPDKNHLISKNLDNPFYEAFNFVLPGYNLRPLELSGAIGVHQLDKLSGLLAERRSNAAWFQETFASTEGIRIQQETGSSSWFGFSIILEGDLEGKRDEVVNELTEMGVECRPIVSGNFANMPVLEHFDYEIHNELKNSDYLDRNGFFIGNHHYNVKEELTQIQKRLSTILI